MNQKTITLDAEIIDVLNKKRPDIETWNKFFRRIMESIPKKDSRMKPHFGGDR